MILIELMFELNTNTNYILFQEVYQEFCHKILLKSCIKIKCHLNYQPAINYNYNIMKQHKNIIIL